MHFLNAEAASLVIILYLVLVLFAYLYMNDSKTNPFSTLDTGHDE